LRYQKLRPNLLLIFINIGNRRNLPMSALTITCPPSPDAELTRDGYEESLIRLRHATTGEGRAAILDVMADQAGGIAVQFRGQRIEGGDSGQLAGEDEPAYLRRLAAAERGDCDPVAWEDAATFLRRLAAAERGLILIPAGFSDGEHLEEWEDLAGAATAAEHAAAAAAVLATFATEDDEAHPAVVRPGALLRFREAAAACTAAYRAGAAW
jgi:hypothetical protein